MTLILCPGMHPVSWTESFLEQLDTVCPTQVSDRIVFTSASGRQWSPYGLRTYLTAHTVTPPVTLLAFSAGCVAASGIAQHWQQQGYPVAGLIAMDGWGVPTVGKFATHRLSHDAFTHQSSAWLGKGDVSFYAEPPVAHDHLWRYPAMVYGQQVGDFNCPGSDIRVSTTALQFLHDCLQHLQGLETVDAQGIKKSMN